MHCRLLPFGDHTNEPQAYAPPGAVMTLSRGPLCVEMMASRRVGAGVYSSYGYARNFPSGEMLNWIHSHCFEKLSSCMSCRRVRLIAAAWIDRTNISEWIFLLYRSSGRPDD